MAVVSILRQDVILTHESVLTFCDKFINFIYFCLITFGVLLILHCKRQEQLSKHHFSPNTLHIAVMQSQVRKILAV